VKTVRRILPALVLVATPFVLAAKPAPKTVKTAPPIYQPDLSQWRLEVSPALGGWLTEGRQELRLKIVDPNDPAPPKDEAAGSEYGEGGYWGGDDEGEYYGDRDVSADQLRAERLEREDRRKRNQWRERHLMVWLNGDTSELYARVGQTTTFTIQSQNGENRLEVWEKDSGKRVARSWWASAARTRLRVASVRRVDDEWGGGNLEILEPNGDLASQGKRTNSGGTLSWSGEFLHPTPPMGTYTLRWTGGYRGGKPFTVVIEATLDSGTDQERRWHFERLILPGAGPVTLGTLDVEN